MSDVRHCTQVTVTEAGKCLGPAVCEYPDNEQRSTLGRAHEEAFAWGFGGRRYPSVMLNVQ